MICNAHAIRVDKTILLYSGATTPDEAAGPLLVVCHTCKMGGSKALCPDCRAINFTESGQSSLGMRLH